MKLEKSNIVTSDIDNYWAAYDKVTSTKDTVQQALYLKTLFLDKASEGQRSMIQARNYSDEEYLYAINNFPNYGLPFEKIRLPRKQLTRNLNWELEN